MCGIAGLLGMRPDVALDVMGRMLDRISHRGPDDRRTFIDGETILGFARLSIIDLSPAGGQPIENEDGTVTAVVNGEIYNYLELRAELKAAGHVFRGASDAEVVPHLYEEHGDRFVDRLRGMFAIAIWDASRARLLLVRDRLGKKPLFFSTMAGGGLAFASEMKALFDVPGIDLRTRSQGIIDYLTHGLVPGPETVYRGIRRVRPAHRLVYQHGRPVREERYWRLQCAPKRRIGREEALEEILHRLRNAVGLRLRSDVPVGCFLSGGIDSGLVAALAKARSDSAFRTFSIGFEDRRFDERAPAARVAAHIGAEHTERLVLPVPTDRIVRCFGHYDEPFFDPGALSSMVAAETVKAAGIKVVLTGDGGDEVFAGYPYVVVARLLSRLRALGLDRVQPLVRTALSILPASSGERTAYQFAHRFLRVIAEPAERRYLGLTNDLLTLAEVRRLWPSGAVNLDMTGWVDRVTCTSGLGAVDGMLLQDVALRLPDNHLIRLDMATMAHGVEARSPLLDTDVIEFAAQLPEHVRFPGGRTKPLLRDLADRLLPPSIARAPKRGLGLPLTTWLSRDLRGFVHERLLDSSSYAWNNFDRRVLKEVLEERGLDTRDPWRWAKVVWALVCLEIWWERHRSLHVA